jgi:hypothetical protein
MVSPGKVGLAAVHSMMYGTPVVTHGNRERQMPEFEMISHRVNGSLFTFGDIHDLAKELVYWESSVVSREEVRRLCYKIIDEKYNPMTQVEVLIKAINS